MRGMGGAPSIFFRASSHFTVVSQNNFQMRGFVYKGWGIDNEVFKVHKNVVEECDGFIS